MSAFAAMLLCAAVAAWIVAAAAPASARAFIRFAAMLYAALAAANVVDARLADAVALIVSAVAPTMLALAALRVFHRPPAPSLAAVLLVTTCLAGMAAAATGLWLLAFVPLAVSVTVLIVVGSRRLGDSPTAAAQTMVSAAAFVAGASAFVTEGAGARAALLLFSAAGLLGIALALARDSGIEIEQESGRDPRAAAAIRRAR